MMTVKELKKLLKDKNPDAIVMVITADGEYQQIYDCEEEKTDFVTIGCESDKYDIAGDYLND